MCGTAYWGLKLSDWIQTSREVLKRLKELQEIPSADRLDLLKSMNYSLRAIERSIIGWLEWINNPNLMASFSLEEIKEMHKTILDFAIKFLEYDIQVTKMGEEITARKEGRRGYTYV